MNSAPLTLDDLTSFNVELAALVRAGVPLEPGLCGLAADRGGSLSRLCGAVAQRMSSGASLDDALAAAGNAVPAVYRAVVRAGLRSGRLPAALETMAGLGQELAEIRRRIGQALIQPLLLLVLAYVLLVVFGIDLLERYQSTFEQFELVPPKVFAWRARATTTRPSGRCAKRSSWSSKPTAIRWSPCSS